MKYKQEIKLYKIEIEKYLSGISVGNDEKRKIKKAVREILLILEKNGKNLPEDSDIEEYRGQSTTSERTTKQAINRINAFFDWLRKEQSMTEEKENTTLDEDESVGVQPEAEIPTEEVTQPKAQPEKVKPKSKAGRKPKGENGELREKKVTVYMTNTQLENFKALCLLKHMSEADYGLSLIVAEIAKNEKALSFFRKAEKLIE